MSDEYMYGRTSYAATVAEPEGRKIEIGRILVVLNVLLALIIAGELVFHFLISPNLVIRRIMVESEVTFSNEEILRIAGITGKEYYFSLDTELVRRNLEASPLVRKAHIEKIFPDSLRVVVYGRKPAVLCLASAGDRTVPVALDEEGVVFLTGDAAAGLDLPVLSGIVFQEIEAGMRLPSVYVPFLKELDGLVKRAPELVRLISELRIVRKTDREFEVLVYPANHRVPVRIGPEINEKLCTYIMMVLDVMERENLLGSMDEIDFRTGEVVYSTREGQGAF